MPPSLVVAEKQQIYQTVNKNLAHRNFSGIYLLPVEF